MMPTLPAIGMCRTLSLSPIKSSALMPSASASAQPIPLSKGAMEVKKGDCAAPM